jgi:hypothetical protein
LDNLRSKKRLLANKLKVRKMILENMEVIKWKKD